jgi:hypothetical protein
VLLTKYYSGDQIQENEISWACDMYEEGDGSIYCFGGETCRKQTAWKTYVLEGRIILELISKKFDVRAWTGLFCFRQGQVVGSCKHWNGTLIIRTKCTYS